MRGWMTRMIYGLLFAIPLGLVTAVWVQAAPSLALPGDPPPECETCHMSVHKAWEGSQHGQAVSDPKFVEAWMAQGEPVECLQCHTTGFDEATGSWDEDGITCTACHGEPVDGHPAKAMPTNRSAELCAGCHSETAFEWQISPHAVDDMTCVTCHGQHSTNIKAGDASALCSSCHFNMADSFVHGKHLEEGMSCASCHLEETNTPLGEGKSSRNHTFSVNLDSCEQCHAYQAHDEGVIPPAPAEDQPVLDPLEAETAGLHPETANVDPVTFALLAALVGMAAGMILAPWIERWYQRLAK